MKTSKPYPSKTTTSSSTNTNANASTTNAPEDHGGDGVEAGIDEFQGTISGETASAAAPSSLAPLDAPPTRERVSNGDDLHRKPKSTPGQDVSRPGAYHETYVTPSIASAAPPRNPNQGFNKDEFTRHRPGETAASPSTLAPSDVAARRDWRSSRDEYDRKVAGQNPSDVAPSSSVPPDVAVRRDWRSSGDEYNRKLAGETSSAVAPSSSVPPDAPTGERGYGLAQFQGKVSSSATEGQEPDEDYSQPGVFRVAETLDRTIGETDGVERVTALPPVPELHLPEIDQYQENTRGQYLAEATLVSKHDVLIGEIVEEPKALWRQPKVQRLAFFLLLLVIGVVVAVVAAVGGGSTPESLAPTLETSLTPTLENTEVLRLAVDNYLADNNGLAARTYGRTIGVWDVSKIQDFSFLFAAFDNGDNERFNTDAENFDEDISVWDMSSATTMRSMFDGTTSFNQPIGNWTVSSVTDMAFIFFDATSFNQPIGTWDVSSATTMASMFHGATSFSQPLGDWKVPPMTDLTDIFTDSGCRSRSRGAPSCFYTLFETTSELRSAVDDYLADNSTDSLVARTYGWPIGAWDVSMIQDFSYLFAATDFDNGERFNPDAADFNENITLWDVLSATTMASMFHGATSFGQPLGGWKVSPMTDLTDIFTDSGCRSRSRGAPSCFYTLGTLFKTTSELRGAVDDYLADNSTDTLVARTYGWPIGAWDVSKIQDFSLLFAAFENGDNERFNTDAENFDEDIRLWDMSSATTVRSMFFAASSFNQPLADWDVSSMTNMGSMFTLARSFSQPIGNWDVSSATTMRFMFFNAESFDQTIGTWDVSSVTDLSFMFGLAKSFNQPLGNWDRSSVTSTDPVFSDSGCPFADGVRSCFYV